MNKGRCDIKQILTRLGLLFLGAAIALLALPLTVGAVTAPDALSGLRETLANQVGALQVTVQGMVSAYNAYLTALQ